jgi:hypothetical protein
MAEVADMAALVWRHGRSKAEAMAAIRSALAESGHGGAAKWDGARVEARYGPFAAGLHARGEVTDEAVVLEKCSGLLGGLVLARCRELLGGLFPGGGPA